MPSVTTFLGATSTEYIINRLFAAATESPSQAAHIVWPALMNFFRTNWHEIALLIIVIFVILTVNAMLGQWGALGSFIYNLLYFSILLLIGIIWGVETFLKDYFHTGCAMILYPTCYYVTGLILDCLGVRKKFHFSR